MVVLNLRKTTFGAEIKMMLVLMMLLMVKKNWRWKIDFAKRKVDAKPTLLTLYLGPSKRFKNREKQELTFARIGIPG